MPRYFAFEEAKKEEAEALGQIKMIGAMIEEICERYPFIEVRTKVIIHAAARDEHLMEKYTYTTNVNFNDGEEF